MTAGFIVVGLVVIAIFVRRQLKLENPLLKVTVLKTRNYRIAIIVAIINFGVLIASALSCRSICDPAWLLGARDRPHASARCADRAPSSATSQAVCSTVGAWRKCVVPGVTIFFVGTLGFLIFDMNTDLLVICAIYTVVALGIQFLTTPMNTWGINSLDNSVIQHAECGNERLEPGLGCVHDGAHRVHLSARFDHRAEC